MGYELKVADCQEEFRQIFELRYIAFCLEKPFYNKEKYPDGLLKDDFDDASIHIITKRKGVVITAARLTPFQEKGPLFFPALRFTNFPEKFYNHKTFEMSSGIVKTEFRRTGTGIKALNFIYEYSKQQKINYLLAIANKELFKIFKKTKLSFVYFGEPENCEGFISYPFVCEVKKSINVF